MTLTITATNQPAQLEEVTEAGFMLLTQHGEVEFYPSEEVTHPDPACPECSSETGTYERRVTEGKYQTWIYCRSSCGFTAPLRRG